MPKMTQANAEEKRLQEDERRKKNWKRWGPYLSERQWGTVREDYSLDGTSWDYFPHDHARSRIYRWGEDGLFGITDRECRLCFSLALWNGQDPILKERLFGLGGPEGNHGEDVKEYYFYLDSTPTHSYMKALYKYPQSEFPYRRLVEENQRRGRRDSEFELFDTGVFNDQRYFDVMIEYAKGSPNDILIQITVTNRGPENAKLDVIPTLWFRNTWAFGGGYEADWKKPQMHQVKENIIQAEHESLGRFLFVVDQDLKGEYPPFIFTENETNFEKLFGVKNSSSFVKDAFHEYIIHGQRDTVNSKKMGTKAGVLYPLNIKANQEIVIRLRLFSEEEKPAEFFGKGQDFNSPLGFNDIFQERRDEAEEFYSQKIPERLSEEKKRIMRQAYAGLLWSKQFYYYSVKDWLPGDPVLPLPAPRRFARNKDWKHLFNRDILSMPDKWEYPWYAAWDLAFHMIPFSEIDPDFAKSQMMLLLREWYMHPNGEIPAYEFAFSDANPPVHAWACWRIYKMTGTKGNRDRGFLEKSFQKLLVNFTWWVNRKDSDGNHLFSGGFLGLDNVGIFDQSRPLPGGGHLEQADGTAWMAFYCATMLSMALELAKEDAVYEDIASKFFEHFVAIVDAMNTLGGSGLWDEADGFYYSHIHAAGKKVPLKVRSMVGIIPLFAVEILEEDVIRKLPGFSKRMQWFLDHRQDLAIQTSYMCSIEKNGECHRLLAIPSLDRLKRVLEYVLDENEFLSPFGIRSLSRRYQDHPYSLNCDGQNFQLDYEPGNSTTGLFGGNSNWRGPVWFPVNYLLIEALERYHHFYGESLTVEFPTGSGLKLNLKQVARELTSRLVRLFLSNGDSHSPWQGETSQLFKDDHWKDFVLFYEFFHGDNGQGLGASHQTGWTSLIIRCIRDLAKNS
jgi:hypothetical protein